MCEAPSKGWDFALLFIDLRQSFELEGWVLNSAQGVFIEGEGPRDSLNRFLLRLEKEKPPRAVIQSFESSFLDPVNYSGFEIRESQQSGAKDRAHSAGHRHLCRLCRRDFRSR